MPFKTIFSIFARYMSKAGCEPLIQPAYPAQRPLLHAPAMTLLNEKLTYLQQIKNIR